MALQTSLQSVTPLRTVTRSLADTPIDQIANIAIGLADLIKESRDVLQTSDEAGSKHQGSSEDLVLIHRLQTQLSAFIYDRFPSRRFTAIVLIKTYVEAAGLRAIEKELYTWIRGLLNVLKVSSR